MLARWLSTVRSEMNRRAATWAFVAPSATSPATSISRRDRGPSGACAATRAGGRPPRIDDVVDDLVASHRQSGSVGCLEANSSRGRPCIGHRRDHGRRGWLQDRRWGWIATSPPPHRASVAARSPAPGPWRSTRGPPWPTPSRSGRRGRARSRGIGERAVPPRRARRDGVWRLRETGAAWPAATSRPMILAEAEAIGGERDSLIEFATERSPDSEQDRRTQREERRRHGPGEVDRLRAVGDRCRPSALRGRPQRRGLQSTTRRVPGRTIARPIASASVAIRVAVD